MSEASPSGYSPPAYSPPPSGNPPAQSKVLSIISLVTGILGVLAGLFGSGLLFSIAAIVLGHIGQRRESVSGKPLWLTGLITGYVGLLINVVVLVIFTMIAFAGIASEGNMTY